MIRSSENFPSKAAQFLGNLAKKSERNGRNGNPRKSDSDTGKRSKMGGGSQPSDFFCQALVFM